jgi:histone demethylase JARID1
LEELQAWQDDIAMLPFQPEEEDTLSHIIDTAQEFRNYIANLIQPIMSTPDELPVQRFYLRKIEGAEVLLVEETNFLRQQLHRWAPVAPEPPKMIEVSLSTRKPRPTKAQKLMAQMGVSTVDELPEHMRPKIPRKRPTNDYISGKGSKPANPSSAAKPGESIRSRTPQAETPTPTGTRDMRSPLASLPPHNQASHEHSRSNSYSFNVGVESESPVNMHAGPSPFGAPTSPLFPATSGSAAHAGADAVDPALEDMFGTESPVHHHRVPSGGSAQGTGPEPDLFTSLTNGVQDEEDGLAASEVGAAMGSVGEEAGGFGFPESAAYPSMETEGDVNF